MRILTTIALLLLLAGNGQSFSGEPRPDVSPPRDFKAYLRLLIANSPDLKRDEAALAASRRRPDQAGSLPDPMVQVGVMNVPYESFSLGQEPMTQKQITIMQSFPASGTLGMMRKVAQDDVAIATAEVPERRLALIELARTECYRLAYLKRVRKIVVRNRKILEGFIQVALTKYSVGKGLQQNVLHAQLELTKMNDRLRRIEQMYETTRQKLAVRADLPLDTPFDGIEAAPLTVPHDDADTLLSETMNNRPMFERLRAEIQKAEDQTGLARLGLKADYTVAFSYGQRDDGPTGPRDDFVSASVTFKIPWWKNTKQEQKIAETAIMRDKAQQAFHVTRFAARETIVVLLGTIAKDQDLLELYDSALIPQAQQAVDASVAAYQVNKVDFLTMVTNQITLFDYEVKRSEIAFELHSGLAMLWRTLGRDREEAR